MSDALDKSFTDFGGEENELYRLTVNQNKPRHISSSGKISLQLMPGNVANEVGNPSAEKSSVLYARRERKKSELQPPIPNPHLPKTAFDGRGD